MDLIKAQQLFSQARMLTYQNLANGKDPVRLYLFNIEISSTLHLPLHICEILLRNIVDRAINKAYCNDWHLNRIFKARLDTRRREQLEKSVEKNVRKDKVIAELNFNFWVYLASQKHRNLWENNFYSFFPNYQLIHPKSVNADNAIKHLNKQLVRAKDIRNRIAHYEPIITKNLNYEYNNIMSIIHYIDADCFKWIQANQLAITNISNFTDYLKGAH